VVKLSVMLRFICAIEYIAYLIDPIGRITFRSSLFYTQINMLNAKNKLGIILALIGLGADLIGIGVFLSSWPSPLIGELESQKAWQGFILLCIFYSCCVLIYNIMERAHITLRKKLTTREQFFVFTSITMAIWVPIYLFWAACVFGTGALSYINDGFTWKNYYYVVSGSVGGCLFISLIVWNLLNVSHIGRRALDELYDDINLHAGASIDIYYPTRFRLPPSLDLAVWEREDVRLTVTEQRADGFRLRVPRFDGRAVLRWRARGAFV
jgi:hypothetical protein